MAERGKRLPDYDRSDPPFYPEAGFGNYAYPSCGEFGRRSGKEFVRFDDDGNAGTWFDEHGYAMFTWWTEHEPLRGPPWRRSKSVAAQMLDESWLEMSFFPLRLLLPWANGMKAYRVTCYMDGRDGGDEDKDR